MTNERPLILITNGDDVWAKGINESIECLKDLGDLVVFTPDGPRSGMGSAITSLVPIKRTLLEKEEGPTIYNCTGTPADCVKLAINEVMERKPGLLVSGINHRGNMAICANYSRTTSATIEGYISNVPSMGVSLLDRATDADFSEYCRLERMLACRVLKEGLPHGTYLNLNVPKLPQVKGLKVYHQADGRRVREFKCSGNASGESVFWLTGAFESARPIHPGNDMLALGSGCTSLALCKIDVTDYNFMATLNNWIL